MPKADFIFLSLDAREVAFCFSTCAPPSADLPPFDRDALKHNLNTWLIKTVDEHRGRRPYPSLVLSLAYPDRHCASNILSEDVLEALKDDVVVLGVERSSLESEVRLSAYEQMPYPSALHLPLRQASKQARISDLGKWQLKQNRTITWGGLLLVRPQMIAHSSLPCSFYSPHTLPSDQSSSNSTTKPIPSEHTRVHQAMAQSTFCIHLPDDPLARQGFVDSILLGCIPIIFRRRTYERLWRGQVELEELAVVLNETDLLEGDGGVMMARLRVPTGEEIERKKEAIARVAEKWQYGYPTSAAKLMESGRRWTDDAVGMLLRQLVLLKEEAELKGANSEL